MHSSCNTRHGGNLLPWLFKPFVMRKSWYVLLIAGATLQGCDKETVDGPVDCTKNPVMLELVSTSDADCALKDGQIEVAASGGSGPYSFMLNDGPGQSNPLFEALGAGVYKVTVKDKNDCTTTLEATVNSSSGITTTAEATNAGCGTSNASLTVNADNGTPPYQYKLGTGSFSETNTFSNLSAGDYTVVVRDATGCEISRNVDVKSGVSYSNTISGIIETKCAISGCHNGSQAPDFRSFTNIKGNASQIKTLTGNGTMPQEGSLTQEQIAQIACWVDDGAPQN